MAEIIDGNKISSEIRDSVKDEIADIKAKTGGVPGLAVIMMGENPASASYVRMKGRRCDEVGIQSWQYNLPEDADEKTLLDLVQSLNNNSGVNGILVQLPLPLQISEKKIIESIDPLKDVDGFHPVNAGRMMTGDDDCFLPCTPYGIQELIARHVRDLKGRHLVVVGRSNIVGKPVANMMLQKKDRANCVVTVCHTAAKDIGYYTRQADILVVAAGRAGMVTGSMVKHGAVVIDVGMNRVPDPADRLKSILTGDVNFKEVSEKASAITPVPGGVGPMTIAMLLKNTVKAFRLQNKM